MLQTILEDFKDLEDDCKDLVISGYIAHRDELIRLPKLPEAIIVIGDNWSYSARSSLTTKDLEPVNPIATELRKRKMESIQYIKHFLDEGQCPNFEQVVLAHLQIPPRIKGERVYDHLIELRKFLSLFLIGDRRLSEAEAYQQEWQSRRERMSLGDLQQRVLFLYDSQLRDIGVTILYQ